MRKTHKVDPEKETEEIGITVIMPVYNVEQYVAKAIKSIINQTYRNFEFIIVDDGTQDKSGKICDEFASRDDRIKVIHQNNSGAAASRNRAIDMAKGKYLYFMDSDDWAELTMLEKMYNLAEENKANLVVTGFYIDTYSKKRKNKKNSQFTQIQQAPEAFYDTKEKFRNDAYRLFDNNLLYSPWNKLFCKDYVRENALYFPQMWMDDFPFVLSYIKDIDRVVVSEEKFYHFIRARADSETAKYRSDLYEKRQEEHLWMTELYKYWNIKDEKKRQESMEMVYRRYIERVIGCIENVTNCMCKLSSKQKKNEIRQILTNCDVKEAILYAKPKSFYMKLLLKPVKWENTTLCYIEGKVISYVKNKYIKTFAKLKYKR